MSTEHHEPSEQPRDEQTPAAQPETPSPADSLRATRRKLLAAGLAAAPLILTARAQPVWAGNVTGNGQNGAKQLDTTATPGKLNSPGGHKGGGGGVP